MAQMATTLGMVRENSIRRTMQSAIDDKAALCSIERELIGKMDLCLDQLGEELAESKACNHLLPFKYLFDLFIFLQFMLLRTPCMNPKKYIV